MYTCTFFPKLRKSIFFFIYSNSPVALGTDPFGGKWRKNFKRNIQMTVCCRLTFFHFYQPTVFGPNYGETKVQTYIPLFDMLKVPYGGRCLFHVLAKIIRTSSAQYGGPNPMPLYFFAIFSSPLWYFR